MGLETPTYISDLNTAWPLGSDAKSTTDDHLRNFKSAVKTTFPNITGVVSSTHTELSYASGVTSAIQTQLNSKGAIAGQTWTGTHNFPATTYGVTASVGSSGTALATLDYVNAQAFSAALPSQTGSGGKLLTTNGSAASWTAIKTINSNSLVGSGDLLLPNGLTLLATVTPTVAASIDFLNTFSSTYDNYLIVGTGIKTGTNGAVSLRVANAGSVDSGSVYYWNNGAAGATSTSRTSMLVNDTSIIPAGTGISFAVSIRNANDTSGLKYMHSEAMGQTAATPTYANFFGDCVYVSANAISGFRLYLDTGANFAATGKIRVYGYQNS